MTKKNIAKKREFFYRFSFLKMFCDVIDCANFTPCVQHSESSPIVKMELNDKMIPDLISCILVKMKSETNGLCTQDFQKLLTGLQHPYALCDQWIELKFKVPRYIREWLFSVGYNAKLVKSTEPGSCGYPSDAWDICDCNLCSKDISVTYTFITRIN
jgi:hypothetical protein